MSTLRWWRGVPRQDSSRKSLRAFSSKAANSRFNFSVGTLAETLQRTVREKSFTTSLARMPRAESEREVSAEKAVRLKAAKNQVSVGDGGLDTAAITDGARVSSGGFGAHAENAGSIEAS